MINEAGMDSDARGSGNEPTNEGRQAAALGTFRGTISSDDGGSGQSTFQSGQWV